MDQCCFKHSVCPVSLPPSQGKAEGEPEEKRGKIELVADEDEDVQDDEADEGPEEVQETSIWLMVSETQEDLKEGQSGLLGVFDSTRPDRKQNCPLTGRTLQQDHAQWQIHVFPPTSLLVLCLFPSFSAS